MGEDGTAVLLLHPDDFRATTRPEKAGFELRPIPGVQALEPYQSALAELWYPGLVDSWRGPFSWGEKLYLGLVDGQPVSFNWMQVGSASGSAVHWGRIFEGEFRILRGGVAPSMRGQGLNTIMKHRLIESMFDAGATRAYAECYEANIPSVRTLEKLAFRAFARLEVLELPLVRNFVRWRGLPKD